MLKSDLKNAATQLGLDAATLGSYPATIEAANNGTGIAQSEGTVYQYTYTAATNSYCLSATSAKTSNAFHATSPGGAITDGVCNGHSASGVVIPEISYAVGDVGPAGGQIFYDKGSKTDGWRYLESALNDLPGLYEWGCKDAVIPGTTADSTGSGKQNTQVVIAQNCTPTNSANLVAATAVDAYTLGGLEDWFIPSKDELQLLAARSGYVGGFNRGSDAYYWTSSTNAGRTWARLFGNPGGGHTYTPNRDTLLRVRPIRSF